MSTPSYAGALSSTPLADGRSLYRLGFCALLLAGVGCREEGGPPTAPEADPLAPAATATASLTFVQVAQGSTHSCGVTADSRAYCWGSNSLGELGNGTQDPSLTPSPVAGGHQFQSVSAGSAFSCGLTTDGAAYCWGANFDGTLGSGSAADLSLTPVTVAGDRRYRQLRAGAAHVCAVTLGEVSFCWGNNLFRQLGATLTAPARSSVPLRVQTGHRIFRRLIPGGTHTCGLTADGVAYCWGNNSSGQLGTGTTGQSMPLALVRGGHHFSQLSAGQDHTCGVADGKAYCWGANDEGELGDGTRSNRTRPRAVTGGLTFKGVSASNQFSCGITASNLAYCWGLNSVGQLGNGAMGSSRPDPVRVLGGHSFTTLGGMTSSLHACAVTPDQRAYCWGRNTSGQLGDGTTTNRTRPVAVD